MDACLNRRLFHSMRLTGCDECGPQPKSWYNTIEVEYIEVANTNSGDIRVRNDRRSSRATYPRVLFAWTGTTSRDYESDEGINVEQ